MKKLESLENSKFKSKELKNPGHFVGATSQADGSTSSFTTHRSAQTNCPPHPTMTDSWTDTRYDYDEYPQEEEHRPFSL